MALLFASVIFLPAFQPVDASKYAKIKNTTLHICILLCSEKSDALVELTLPEDSNVYASQYSLYLPDKTLLQRKLKD